MSPRLPHLRVQSSNDLALLLCLGTILLLPALWGCAGASFVPNEPDDDDENVDLARAIEEADIVRLEDDILYVANPYTGLRLIDVSKPDEPRLLPAVQLTGRTVELYVRDDRAYVFTAADFQYCAGKPVGFDDETWESVTRPGYEGTALWVLDVANPEEANLLLTITFSGTTVATQRVGDILYAAGSIGSTGFVQSIDISDPNNVHAVENKRLSAPVDFVHVTPRAVYLVGEDPDQENTSLVTYIDITDPAGTTDIRDTFRVRGTIASRFFMDEHAGVFHIVTEEFLPATFDTVVALYAYDVSDPDDIERLARLPLATNEGLRSVRFAGDLAYVMTAWAIRPLRVLDLSDPESPAVADEIDSPGVSTNLVPLGERLLTVGFLNGQVALNLFDVSDPHNLRTLSTVALGPPESWSQHSAAVVDEKAVRILTGADLVLIPFAYLDDETAEYRDELQLVTMAGDDLRRRGRLAHRGLIRRADLLAERAWILSDMAFQVFNLDDLDEPESVANVELVDEQELLDAGLLRCVDSARFRGTSVWDYSGGYWGCGALPAGSVGFAAIGLIGLGRCRRMVRRHS